MINILLSSYDFNNEYCYPRLIKYLKSNMKVLIVPLTHNKKYYEQEILFDSLYNYEKGKDYNIICKSFHDFGIYKPNIQVLNPFKDNIEYMKYKIKTSDVLFFTGGCPITFMKMAKKLNILYDLQNYKGIVMGASAGAMIQMKEFMTYPNEEKYSHNYYQGLGYIKEYDVIVHMDKKDKKQNIAIDRSLIDRPNVTLLGVKDGECIIFESKKIYKKSFVDILKNIWHKFKKIKVDEENV